MIFLDWWRTRPDEAHPPYRLYECAHFYRQNGHEGKFSNAAPIMLFVRSMLLVLVSMVCGGCVSPDPGHSSGAAAPPMAVLGESIEALRQQFNADKDKVRVLALFSPT